MSNIRSKDSPQEREYTQSDEIVIKNSDNDKYRYEHVDDHVKKVQVLDFIPIEDTPRRKRKLEASMMPLTAPEEGSVKRKKKLQSLAAFRSTTKSGYHASTAPEQFLKKKYSSTKLRNVNRLVFPGSMNSLSQSDIYSNILKSYPEVKRKKKKVRGRRHRKKKSKYLRCKSWVDINKPHASFHILKASCGFHICFITKLSKSVSI